MRNTYILTTLLLLFFAGVAKGENTDSLKRVPDLQKREMQILKQQWVNSDNAAGMSLSKVDRGSFTTLSYYKDGGDYHKVQQGSKNSGFLFRTERYDRFNDKVFVRGTFSFNNNKEYDRGWSDVINTYNANPFIFGSSVRGDYEKQQFDLNLKVYSVTSGRFNFGFTVDYKVADIARQRDPRSRTYMLDYSLIPSMLVSLSDKHKVGIDLYYRFSKEKMPGLTTIQTDPNLKYYTFSGVEFLDGKIGGYKGFSRQFLSDIAGGGLQYNYFSNDIKLLVSFGFDAQWEQTLGDKKQSPGSYNSFNYRLLSDLLVKRGDLLHNLRLSGAVKDGGADEFRQNQITSRDPITGITTETWETIYVYKNRFIAKTANIKADWRIIRSDKSGNGYKWIAGIEGGYSQFSNYHYLPSSVYEAGKANGGINGLVRLLSSKGRTLELKASVNAGIKTGTKLEAALENEAVTNILEPDIQFHNRNTIDINGDLRYTFPLKLGKVSNILGYAKIYGGNIFASGSKQWYSAGLSIGILTL